MSKISGKDLEFWFDGAEVPVISVNHENSVDQQESTDTATPGTGKDFEALWASGKMKVEAELYEPLGAELSSGDLVAGTRYIVTAGTIAETQGSFTVGMIFESDGSGNPTVDNKVKPLGARINGKSMAFTFNSVEAPVTDIDYNSKFDELDSTDSSSVTAETEVSRADRETKVTAIVRSESADLLTTDPVKQAAILAFSDNVSVAGQLLPISKSITDNTKEMAKIDYTFKWIGLPTETALGLASGEEKAVKFILKRGTSTNKEYTANAIITAKNVKVNIKGLATITYDLSINGAITEAVAN